MACVGSSNINQFIEVNENDLYMLSLPSTYVKRHGETQREYDMRMIKLLNDSFLYSVV